MKVWAIRPDDIPTKTEASSRGVEQQGEWHNAFNVGLLERLLAKAVSLGSTGGDKKALLELHPQVPHSTPGAGLARLILATGLNTSVISPLTDLQHQSRGVPA